MDSAVRERDVDAGELYGEQRRALIGLLRSLPPDRLGVVVPATPDWSVHDVIAHLVGITADLNAQYFGEGTTPEEWTAAQVAQRRDQTLDDLDAEWEQESPRFEEGLRLLGYEIGSHYVGDLLQHAGDIRHALGLPPERANPALPCALDFYLISFEQTLTEAELGAVRIEVGDEGWTLGPGDVIARLEADRYEAFRMLGGRRSREQIRNAHWSGDVDALLPLVSRYPLPDQPLVEAP